MTPRSIHLDPLLLEIRSRHINLSHQFPMRLRYIVESVDSPSELEKEVRTERDEGPERKLKETTCQLSSLLRDALDRCKSA